MSLSKSNKQLLCVLLPLTFIVGCWDSSNSPSSSGTLNPSKLISYQLIQSNTRQTIDSDMQSRGLTELSGLAECDVKLYQIVYVSEGVNGEPVELSAAVSVPDGLGCEGPYPLLASGHGTRTLSSHTEANVDAIMLDHAFFASHGYVMVNPDYIGLGLSDYDYHPYVHRDTEAQSMIDSILAAQEMSKIEDLSIELSGKVMVKGYSQGGHTAMATQRAIEANYLDEINLVATAPMSGPYALEETLLEGMNPAIPNIGSGSIFSYIIQSYQNVYGNIYTEVSDIFLDDYVDIVSSKFPGDTDIFPLIFSGVFPVQPRDYLQPGFISDFLGNDQHPLRVAARKNEVLDDFTPQTSMVMCASNGDGTVPFYNTTRAQEYFQQQGVNVPVIDVAPFVKVPSGDDPGITHHIQGVPLCYEAVKSQLFDLMK